MVCLKLVIREYPKRRGGKFYVLFAVEKSFKKILGRFKTKRDAEERLNKIRKDFM